MCSQSLFQETFDRCNLGIRLMVGKHLTPVADLEQGIGAGRAATEAANRETPDKVVLHDRTLSKCVSGTPRAEEA